ncbi:MAG: DUF4417 domain-containing protein [Thermoguttaceae bacterium]|nr:DUF4417 domain-containing protein [Thermoguttaceae bacterium]
MMKKNKQVKEGPRKGCQDIWNASMVEGASFSPNDIPLCQTTADFMPDRLVSYTEAKTIYMKARRNGHLNRKEKAFVHFWIDDQKFDGKKKGIWQAPEEAIRIVRHFSGMITPDFSTCLDFPKPIIIYNTYRMRAFGRWAGIQGIPVINNVRWGPRFTWSFCWEGIPQNSIVAIGTVASGMRSFVNRSIFEEGLAEMVRVLRPHSILVYGSSNYKCFDKLKERGIRIKTIASRMNQTFKGGGGRE